MTPQGQLTTSALQALVQDGTLAGSWTWPQPAPRSC